MSQVKIYGLRSHLDPIKSQLSDVIHSCVVDALQYPIDKRFHRFFPLEPDDYYYPAGERTERYTIIELSMFEGRTVEAKKQLIRLLFDRLNQKFGIANLDLEITILETPKYNWGIRGLPGDELSLNYQVNI
ncbi:tautomerase family protein [Chamaesiphon sp. VAR_69_metabat_338]|uniref:tautomerase family protein n=1 Tax=Chamaesiphon sp. VAR_69_metabat_338 TaxID=2964704 RepID=UPI00286E1C07|nr:tautomerase family protein [Chamaesiphon sp. VAR_69_metabat_338]